MNNLLKSCSFLMLIALFSTACGAPATQPESAKENETTAELYEVVLGKSVSDIQVANFLTSNNCRDARPFQICEEIGIALWVNPRQVIETVYLYVNNSAGFEPYKGKFPFGLKFYDTLGAAEYKLKRQGVGHAGRPDTGETPDHTRYWATYHEAGMTIIYNAPFADEDATIYAILLSG